MPAPKGKKTGLRSTGGLNRPGKYIKMIQARCRICSPNGQGKRGWWDSCEHDPYNHFEEIPQPPAMEQQEDGTFEAKPNPNKRYQKVPNWKQIADDPKVASGRMVRIQLERGSKYPEDLGYAPVCDYFNCWEPATIFAKRVIDHEGIQTPVGKYHAKAEAQIMTLRLEGTPIYVGVDDDVKRRAAQIAQVQID